MNIRVSSHPLFQLIFKFLIFFLFLTFFPTVKEATVLNVVFCVLLCVSFPVVVGVS